jgi:hypothetical protein
LMVVLFLFWSRQSKARAGAKPAVATTVAR